MAENKICGEFVVAIIELQTYQISNTGFRCESKMLFLLSVTKKHRLDKNQMTSEFITTVIYIKSVSDLIRVAMPRYVLFHLLCFCDITDRMSQISC